MNDFRAQLAVTPGVHVLDGLGEDAFGRFISNGHVGLGAGIQCGASPAIGEVDHETVAGRFNGALEDFVGRAFLEMKNDVFKLGSCLHV